MAVLAIAETKGSELKKISKELVSVARQISDKVYVLLINGSDDHARELFSSGADVVIKNTNAEYSPQGYANIASAVAQEKGAEVVLIPHGLSGKDYAGRVAVKCKAALIADVVSLKALSVKLKYTSPSIPGKHTPI